MYTSSCIACPALLRQSLLDPDSITCVELQTMLLAVGESDDQSARYPIQDDSDIEIVRGAML